jgi:NAD(P)-dependent dehydrogenase (short-subunit alcohol dehydrogenase family)
VDWASEQLGGLDILISNVTAGGGSSWHCVETDIIGAQALMREGFHICNISMVKSMAMEVAPRGFNVNAVSPGDIEFEGGVGAKLYCFVAKQGCRAEHC